MPVALTWHSIERRLPLVFCLLLLLLVLSFGAFVYQEVNQLAIVAGEERLGRVARQLATLAEAATHERLDASRVLASEPSIVSIARRSPGDGPMVAPDGDQAAIDALRELARTTVQTEVVAVVSLGGETLLAVRGPATRGPMPKLSWGPVPLVEHETAAPVTGEEAAKALGPLQTDGERIFYESWMPIHDESGVIGYLVERRRVDTNSASVALIEGLVGSRANFMYGNSDNSLWTDLQTTIPPPPETPLLLEGPTRYQRPGRGEWIGQAEPIGQTPWTILVEQPTAAVYAPARETLMRLTGVATTLLLVGFAVAWLFSRHITYPLRNVTAAAQAVAGGDYSRRVTIERHDELGILAEAFNSMASEVEESREQLERQVAQRTAKLRETLAELSTTQDELVRKEKLAILGELSSGIGHELRNPLGVMTNAVYLLRAKAAEELPPDAARYLDVLERQIRMAEKIIGDLLDVARVRPPERESVRLDAVVREQIARVEAPATIDVQVDLPSHLPEVRVDPVQIGQVVLNLLSNAVQAMEGTGTLTISAARQDADTVELRVADTGPGVEAEYRERIFEPLFTTKARGIGLGLSVSRSLTRANGGELELAETRGPAGGAVFALALPAAEREAAQ